MTNFTWGLFFKETLTTSPLRGWLRQYILKGPRIRFERVLPGHPTKVNGQVPSRGHGMMEETSTEGEESTGVAGPPCPPDGGSQLLLGQALGKPRRFI